MNECTKKSPCHNFGELHGQPENTIIMGFLYSHFTTK